MTTFPTNFTWGVSTSAYQIEGGREDGKGESIWDRFAHQRLPAGINGDVACDHYHRFEEDVALMAELGVTAYRFSIAWTRVIPDGRGAVNDRGLAFYSDLVDLLLENGIEPWPTLYHWDLPQALQDEGGWTSRATVDAFARYAETMARSLGDRVRHWITQNEPWVAAFIGHLFGDHAPGARDWGAALAAAHHILLSHGRAVEAIRETARDPQVGIALDCRPSAPATDDPADIAAQRHFDGFRNRWFFDPVFGRGYPEDMRTAYRHRGRFSGDHPPEVLPGDLETIAAPLDFLGLNYYTSLRISHPTDESEDSGVAPGPHPPDGFTEMGWERTPAALTRYLKHLHTTYRPESIVITENGASYGDGPGPDGRIRDDRRIAYLHEHLDAVAQAIADGVPVSGYFCWSLLDNLEWSMGYSQRFGLVWVDRVSQRRLPKDSYQWYGGVIDAGGL